MIICIDWLILKNQKLQIMKTLDIVIYTGIIVWSLIEYYYLRFRRSGNGDQKVTDKIGLQRLWIIACFTRINPVLISILIKLPISNIIEFRYFGLAVFIGGVLLRALAIRNLGNFFTMDLTIKKDHQLITNGVYRYVRHPSYTAMLIGLIGIGLALNNWLSLLIGPLVFFLAFERRIADEERGLIGKFGNEYIQYQKRTKKWIPFIY